jgi:hypothetical protein
MLPARSALECGPALRDRFQIADHVGPGLAPALAKASLGPTTALQGSPRRPARASQLRIANLFAMFRRERVAQRGPVAATKTGDDCRLSIADC